MQNKRIFGSLQCFNVKLIKFSFFQIMSTLPRTWLQGETIEHLKMFANLIHQLSEQLDQANPAHKYVDQ